MTRSFNQKQFSLKEHIERLFNSANYVDIEIPYTKNELFKICEEVEKKIKMHSMMMMSIG